MRPVSCHAARCWQWQVLPKVSVAREQEWATAQGGCAQCLGLAARVEVAGVAPTVVPVDGRARVGWQPSRCRSPHR